MTQIMTAAQMTDGQIENAVNKLRDALRKHRSEITSDVAQNVLGVKNLGMMMLSPFQEGAEAALKLIVCNVKVDRSRTPQEAIDATGRVQFVDQKVVDEMPRGEGEEAEVVFFQPTLSNHNGLIYVAEFESEYDLRGLKFVDPVSVAAINEADPAFADKHGHLTYWKDAEGKLCSAMFGSWGNKRRLDVRRAHGTVNVNWWLAGTRK